MPPQSPLSAPAASTPGSWEDVVRVLAEQEGVPVPLALAVARKESSRGHVDPATGKPFVGDGGKAVGQFQLHEDAAADMGLSPEDRADPLKNIRGGLGYLKKLNVRYKGDVTKTLQAYNGGMKWVDEGTVSPAAQAYAAEVIANLSQNVRESIPGGGAPPPAAPGNVRVVGPPPPVAGRGTAATNIGKAAVGAAKPFNPMTSEGRQNLAATGGSIAVTALVTKGMPVGGLVSLISRVVGPAIGAGTAAAVEVGAEQALGADAYAGDSTAAIKAGVVQGGMEAVGGAALWPVRRAVRALVAPGVAQAVRGKLTSSLDSARTAGRSAVDAVVRESADRLRTMRMMGQRQTDLVAEQGAEHVAKARRVAADSLRRVELSSAETIDQLTKQIDDISQQAPSKLAAGGAVREIVPALLQTLKLAGQRIEQAAVSGPEFSLAGVKSTLTESTNKAKPPSLFPQQAERGAGFLPAGSRVQPTVGARPAMAPAASATMSRAEFQAFLQGQLVTPASERLPLSGILATVAKAPDKIAFRDAHSLKMLLDERVTWDRPAKAVNERLTKQTRNVLREAMAEHGDYNTATAAYQSIVRLQRKGVGAKILTLAQQPDGADKLATILNGNNPAAAQTVKSLLLDQAAASGKAMDGQRAWDSIRSVYTFDHLIAGGVDGLGDRVQKLVSEQPDFARVVFGDESGKQVLTNLGQIAEALQQAKTAQAAQLASTKAIGKAGVEEAKDVTRRATIAAKRGVSEQLDQVKRGAEAQRAAASRTANQNIAEVKAKGAAFGASTLGKSVGQSTEGVAADITRAGALGISSYWGAQSIYRLMRHAPAANEILEWAAYSNYNTGRLTKVLMGQGNVPFTAALIRDLAGIVTTGDQPPSSRVPSAPVPSASVP